jgi:hypothetical protein
MRGYQATAPPPPPPILNKKIVDDAMFYLIYPSAEMRYRKRLISSP